MVWAPHTSENDTRGFITACSAAWSGENRRPYVITESGSDAAIGMFDTRMHGTSVGIGYVLARSHWGMGLMPEVIQVLTSTALASNAVFRVQATCDVENIPSQRALEKSGFTREGRLERYTIHPNISPEPRACFMYARWR